MKIPRSSILLLAIAALLWPISTPALGLTFLPKIGALFCLLAALVCFLRQPFESQKLRRFAKGCLALLLILCILGSISFIYIESLIIGGAKGSGDSDAQVLVVLGAGLNGDRPSAALTARLRAALAHLESHPDSVAILTGSQGYNESRTEASAMAEWLIDAGIDQDRLILEEEAHNTAQNIKFSVALMDKYALPYTSVAVVSNEFHLYRAVRIFERYDMDVDAIPAPTPNIGLLRLNSYVREYCSVLVMYLKDLAGFDE